MKVSNCSMFTFTKYPLPSSVVLAKLQPCLRCGRLPIFSKHWLSRHPQDVELAYHKLGCFYCKHSLIQHNWKPDIPMINNLPMKYRGLTGHQLVAAWNYWNAKARAMTATCAIKKWASRRVRFSPKWKKTSDQSPVFTTRCMSI
jgi:hypothetical protein